MEDQFAARAGGVDLFGQRSIKPFRKERIIGEERHAGTLKCFADGQIAADTKVVTDGHAGYNKKSLGERPHEGIVQTKAERRENDTLQACLRTISLLKRWLLGTLAGAVSDKHLRANLDEFAFRHNRSEEHTSELQSL